VRRRDSLKVIAGWLLVWPLGARAQQAAVPVIGFLGGGSPETDGDLVAGFRQGLSESGYVEGRNVSIEYRWAKNQNDRLPGLVSDLVRREVNVIIGGNTPGAVAAKAATATIPIVFLTASDPVAAGAPYGRRTGSGPQSRVKAPHPARQHRTRYRRCFRKLGPTAGARSGDWHRFVFYKPKQAARCADSSPRSARDLSLSRVRDGRWSNELRRQC
jgi:hypothetical protein